MIINELLAKYNMTKYRLAKISGVPPATINDICSGKTCIEKCASETIYKISKALNITMETLIEPAMNKNKETTYRTSFEIFKSNICHRVKDEGDLDFIANTLVSDEIHHLFHEKWYPEALYLLAMVDYLSRENGIPICANYSDVRAYKLQTPLYPASVIVACAALHDNQLKNDCYHSAIPEFIRFNIVESEIRNVV